MSQPLKYAFHNDLQKCPVEKCETEGWRQLIHRKNRCDLSLFQLGLRMLEHFLNTDLPIPVQFHITI
jgi:hypothetical protein